MNNRATPRQGRAETTKAPQVRWLVLIATEHPGGPIWSVMNAVNGQAAAREFFDRKARAGVPVVLIDLHDALAMLSENV